MKDLRQWNIPAAYIGLGFIDDTSIKPLISPETMFTAVRELKSFLANIELSSHIRRTPAIEQVVKRIADELIGNQCNGTCLENVTEIRNYDDYLLSHSLDVCVLAIITVVGMDWVKGKIVQIGLAALMHDFGKIRVPKSILMKPGPLTPNEWLEVKKHPFYALDILHKESCIMAAATRLDYTAKVSANSPASSP